MVSKQRKTRGADNRRSGSLSRSRLTFKKEKAFPW